MEILASLLAFLFLIGMWKLFDTLDDVFKKIRRDIRKKRTRQ